MKTITCPWCEKVGLSTGMKRWHFDFCPSNPDGKHRKVQAPKKFKVSFHCDRCSKTYQWMNDTLERIVGKYGAKICFSCKQTEEYRSGERKPPVDQPYWQKMKGQPIEAILGEERGKEMRKVFSKKFSGKNNPNYGAKYTRGFADRPIRGKLEDNYSSEKAAQIRKKRSAASSGANNPMYGKPSPKKSGNGWGGTYRGHNFRSLLELSYLSYLIDAGIGFESGELRKHAIRYELDGKPRTYFPEFVLEDGMVMELKPKALVGSRQNVAKFSAARAIHGDRFVVLTEEYVAKPDLAWIEARLLDGSLMWHPSTEKKWIAWKAKKLVSSLPC